jgi:SPP1 gp7 family putative phage head morphogenesis protein
VQNVVLRGVQPGIAPLIDRFQDANARLITKMRDETIQQIRAVLDDAWTKGERVEVMREKLQERFGVSESRADLIARDQTLKLNAEITQTRQTAAGVQKYVWTTSGDERVRPMHDDLDGQTFSWDDPPVTNEAGDRNHPGGDYQCRCTAMPVLDELAG